MSSIDVVVPSYRYGRFLRQCVESVLSQQDVAVRVLVIDDASPDDTAAVATQLKNEDLRVTFVRHLKNKGHIATYNEGIQWASAEYYMILSADDYLLPGALASASSFMDAHLNVGLAYSRAITLDDSMTTVPTTMVETRGASWQLLSGLEFIKLSGARNIVPTPTAVVRTRLQKRLGGYRPELPHSGDFEMWLRLAAHSAVAVSDAYHAVYRRHADNMSLLYTTGSCLRDLGQRKAAFDSFITVCGNVLPNVDKMYQRFSRLLARDAISLASAAFNVGEMKVTDQLSAVALRIYPHVKRSLPWAGLTCKRVVGRRAWSALRPAVDSVRQTSSLLQRLATICRRSLKGIHSIRDTVIVPAPINRIDN